MMSKQVLSVLLMGVLTLSIVTADTMETDPDLILLREFLGHIQTYKRFSIQFDQDNFNVTTGHHLKGNGILKVQIPDRYSWIYTSSPENVITCDGRFIVMVLPGTEQVMFDAASRAEGIWSPVSLLTDTNLLDVFTVEKTGEMPGRVRYTLKTEAPDNRFEYLELEILKSGAPDAFILTVVDASGNQNRLSFSSLRKLDPDEMIRLPEIPSAYDVTDFQGQPRDPGILKRSVSGNEK